MDVSEYKKEKTYGKELLNYIYSIIDLPQTSRIQLKNLIKEHNYITNRLDSDTVIETIESEININKYDYAKLKLLQEELKELKNIHLRKKLFCYISTHCLKIKIKTVCAYLEINPTNFYDYILRLKEIMRKDSSIDKIVFKYLK